MDIQPLVEGSKQEENDRHGDKETVGRRLFELRERVLYTRWQAYVALYKAILHHENDAVVSAVEAYHSSKLVKIMIAAHQGWLKCDFPSLGVKRSAEAQEFLNLYAAASRSARFAFYRLDMQRSVEIDAHWKELEAEEEGGAA